MPRQHPVQSLAAPITRALYHTFAKPWFFRQDPEKVHDNMTRFGQALSKFSFSRKIIKIFWRYDHPALKQTIKGLTFSNPVGLSAGFDKEGILTQILYPVGFGFMEIGSVTLRAYPGNAAPRLYRLPSLRSLLVNYGLKSDGVDAVIQRLHSQSWPPLFRVGISVAKTNSPATVDIKAGVADYHDCLKRLLAANLGEYYTINISCPNAFGGEPFTTPDTLDPLLQSLSTLPLHKPWFIKMPINLSWEEFKDLLDVILKYPVAGVIIGNLQKNFAEAGAIPLLPPGLKGGLSGNPTWVRSNELIRQTYAYAGQRLVIIGVGGIFTAADAYQKIKLGATLVQLITGMVYEGPQLIGEINRGLVKLLQQDGYQAISQAIGAHHRPPK